MGRVDSKVVMTKTAAIFPGQGSQAVGMGKAIAESCARARNVFEKANRVLGFDLAQLCFEGPAEQLEKTDIQQPAIFTASVALWEAILEAGGSRDQFSYMGGLSLGEYTALFAAGSLDFEDGLKLVHERGKLMQRAAESSPSGMASLVGADEAMARELCDKARGADVLAPANFNCPGQIVISGSKVAIERAVSQASEVGCKAVALAVAGAFHSPLMKPAADGLRPLLNAAKFNKPSIPVIANVNADYHGDGSSIRESLAKQVTEPVLWQKCVERMIADGVTQFYEIGPGRVLTGLMRKINRDVAMTTVNSPEGIASFAPARVA